MKSLSFASGQNSQKLLSKYPSLLHIVFCSLRIDLGIISSTCSYGNKTSLPEFDYYSWHLSIKSQTDSYMIVEIEYGSLTPNHNDFE